MLAGSAAAGQRARRRAARGRRARGLFRRMSEVRVWRWRPGSAGVVGSDGAGSAGEWKASGRHRTARLAFVPGSGDGRRSKGLPRSAWFRPAAGAGAASPTIFGSTAAAAAANQRGVWRRLGCGGLDQVALRSGLGEALLPQEFPCRRSTSAAALPAAPAECAAGCRYCSRTWLRSSGVRLIQVCMRPRRRPCSSGV